MEKKDESDGNNNNNTNHQLFFATKTTRNCTAHELLDFTTIVPSFCDSSAAAEKHDRCDVCGKEDITLSEDIAVPCPGCHVVYYCCEQHRNEGLELHKGTCMELLHASEDLKLVEALKISKEAELLKPRSPFPSLSLITNWFVVWKHLECAYQHSDVFQRLMSELLSWPLILIQAVSKFQLQTKKNLQVHILGAKASYIQHGLFSYFLKFFPLPDMEIFLIGPGLCSDVIPLHIKNCVGRWITLSCISDVFCQSYENFGLPDLIIAYHPDVKDENYDWKPTLMYLVTKEIPSVFTMQNEDGYREIFHLLTTQSLNANIHFHGLSPFPSMLKKCVARKGAAFDIEVSNSYWIGFIGDSVTNNKIARSIFDSVSHLTNISSLELDRMLSAVVSSDNAMVKFGQGFIPASFELLFGDALSSFEMGVEKYVNKTSSTSAACFQGAILKSQLPQLQLLTKQLRNQKETCEEKMKSILASSYLYLGLLAKRDGDFVKAMEHTRVSLSVDPGFHLAYYNLGVIYQDVGDIERMIDSFANATKLSPSDRRSWNGLGDAFYKKAMFKEAEDAYEIAKSLPK